MVESTREYLIQLLAANRYGHPNSCSQIKGILNSPCDDCPVYYILKAYPRSQYDKYQLTLTWDQGLNDKLTAQPRTELPLYYQHLEMYREFYRLMKIYYPEQVKKNPKWRFWIPHDEYKYDCKVCDSGVSISLDLLRTTLK